MEELTTWGWHVSEEFRSKNIYPYFDPNWLVERNFCGGEMIQVLHGKYLFHCKYVEFYYSIGTTEVDNVFP